MMRRRDFLLGAAGIAGMAAASRRLPALKAEVGETWRRGTVKHLLPTVSHDRALLKASLEEALAEPPVLRIGPRRVVGQRSDTAGRFWSFDATGLEPATRYELSLHDASGSELCDAWPLRTFPAPEAEVERLRLLVYTCAGGAEGVQGPDGRIGFLSLADRRRLFRRALSFEPDAVVAIGDHVYWDLRGGPSARRLRDSELAKRLDAREFWRDRPVLGTENESKLVRVVDLQIADLYGTLMRSTPVFFLFDDHDYFENDHADDEFIAFPPDPSMLRLARATQRLYYPEFLPDRNRPDGLGGALAGDRPPGVAECFGTLRYGRLAELLLYDCRRFLSLKGPSAGFVPAETERWLVERMRDPEVRFVTQVPSTPIAWSAGKWGEWYPDLLGDDGRLATVRPKPYWQEGWFRQHNRLVAAASQTARLPLFVSGDLHAIAEGRIVRSGELDLRRNPVVSILSGPISTGELGWPSVFRGTPPQSPVGLEVEAGLDPIERNGFTLLDFEPDRLTARFFSWKYGEAPSDIDTLDPFHTLELRPGRA